MYVCTIKFARFFLPDYFNNCTSHRNGRDKSVLFCSTLEYDQVLCIRRGIPLASFRRMGG